MPTIIDEITDLQVVDMPTVDISTYVIKDITVKSINSNVIDIISDYVTLEFTVTSYNHRYHDETSGAIVNTSSADGTVKYTVNIWKSLLHRLYHNIFVEHLTERSINSKDSQYYFQLWVGNTRVICHFDHLRVLSNTITLSRYYQMKNFLYSNGTTTVPDTFIKTRLSTLPLNMGKSNMYITYDGRDITYCNYNLNANYAGVIPSDLTYYLFDLDTSKNTTAFDTMVADTNFYKMSISSELVKTWSPEKNAYIEYNVSSVYIYMKTPFSDDINISLKANAVDRIYRDTKTDTYEHVKQDSGHAYMNESGEYILDITCSGEVLLDKGYTVEFGYLTSTWDMMQSFLKRFFGKAVQIKNKLYLYLNELPGREKDAYWTGNVYQYSGDNIESHVDPVVRNFRVDSSTAFEFDPVRVRYTYTFPIDTEIDNNDSATFTSNNTYVKNNIINVSIVDKVATIVAKVQLGGTTSIPTCIIQVSGTYSYSTLIPQFELVSTRIAIKATDPTTVVDAQYVIEHELYTVNVDKYDTIDNVLDTPSLSLGAPNTDFLTELKNTLTFSNLRFDDGTFKLDIGNYEFFLTNCKISNLSVKVSYTWLETVITENYPFTKSESLSVYIDTDTAKQYTTGIHPDEYYLQSTTINGTKYYIYKCTLGYEYGDLAIVNPDSVTVNYVGLNGDSIAYIKSTVVDPTYATIPSGKVGFSIGYTTFGIPRYTNLDLKLYDMTALSKSKEVHESYQFSGTAYDKFLKLIRIANIEAENMGNAVNIDYTL